MTCEKQKDTILVVDDAVDTLEIIRRSLTSAGYQVFTASGPTEAIEILKSTVVDLLITDNKMPRISGLELIRHVRDNFKDTEIIMITGYATIEGAVEAVKHGVEQYLAKPFTNEELLNSVQKVLSKLHLRRSINGEEETQLNNFCGLIGQSPAMKKIYSDIGKAAVAPATVLIMGESGTGKELVARAIHYNSKHASGPFVPVNCGGIPEGLLESELFGHVKGAFTGAICSRSGFFQTAEGGTIFLDEIGEISLSMQVKLLRVLQDKEVCMVGASRPRSIDARIVAASNKDLNAMTEKDAFRKDLFFRLNVINITIPPLRERRDDVLLLANYFTSKYAKEYEKEPPVISDNAMEVLRDYPWPGNVRELENVIQRLTVMGDSDVIDVSDLPSLMRFSALRDTGLDRSLSEVEAEYIRNVLVSVNGNKSRAAQILKIDRKTLREKIKKHNIPF